MKLPAIAVFNPIPPNLSVGESTTIGNRRFCPPQPRIIIISTWSEVVCCRRSLNSEFCKILAGFRQRVLLESKPGMRFSASHTGRVHRGNSVSETCTCLCPRSRGSHCRPRMADLVMMMMMMETRERGQGPRRRASKAHTQRDL